MPMASPPRIWVVTNRMMSVRRGKSNFLRLCATRFMRPGQSALSIPSRKGMRKTLYAA